MFVSFRGTCFASDLVHVLDIRSKSLCHRKGVHVHHGFYRKYKELENDILRELEHHPEITEIVFTGHSMGGSVAMIAAYHLKGSLQSKAIKCHTFGAPKTGSAAFMRSLKKEIDEVICVSLKKDIIPRIPLNPQFLHEEELWMVDDNMIPPWDLLQNHSCVSYYHAITKHIADDRILLE